MKLTWRLQLCIILPVMLFGIFASSWVSGLVEKSVEELHQHHMRELNAEAALRREGIQKHLHSIYDSLTIIAMSPIFREDHSSLFVDDIHIRDIVRSRFSYLIGELSSEKIIFIPRDKVADYQKSPEEGLKYLPIEEILVRGKLSDTVKQIRLFSRLDDTTTKTAISESFNWYMENHSRLTNDLDSLYPGHVNANNDNISGAFYYTVPVYDKESRLSGLITAVFSKTALIRNDYDHNLKLVSGKISDQNTWNVKTSALNTDWTLIEDFQGEFRHISQMNHRIVDALYFGIGTIWTIVLCSIIVIRQAFQRLQSARENQVLLEEKVQQGVAEIKENEFRFETVLKQSIDAVIMMDARGTVIAWEGQSESIFGWSKDEALGKQLHEMIIPERYHDAHGAGLRRYLHTGETRVLNKRIELQAYRKDKTEFPIELTITAIGQDRKHCIFSAMIRDLTDRKEAEAKLVNTKIELEQALQKAKHSEDQAIKANNIKAQFLANMSHEIRTPINGILGMTRAVLDTPLQQEQRETLKIAETSAEGLLTLVTDILDLSKIESNNLQMTISNFNLHNLIYNSTKPFLSRAQEKQIEVLVQIDPGVPDWVAGDSSRLTKILTNLIGNAVKFTPEQGGIILNARADKNSDKVVISINDSGIGISGEKMRTLFESFSQADASTTRQFGGTGLGLSIAYKLVKAMGGEISVNSIVGVGSSFHITLPLKAVDFTGIYNDTETSEPKVSSKPISELNIWIAEDNLVNQKVIVNLLKKHGYKTNVLNNGREAVTAFERALWENNKIDLILMDCQMPELDGYQATQTIRELEKNAGIERNSGVPIIAVTANAMKGDKEKCLEAGMDGYATKPINPSELFAEFGRLLGRNLST